jgi:hypothetical protein
VSALVLRRTQEWELTLSKLEPESAPLLPLGRLDELVG